MLAFSALLTLAFAGLMARGRLLGLRPRQVEKLLPFHGWRLFGARVVSFVTAFAILCTGFQNHAYSAPPEEVFYYYLPDQLGTTAALVDRDGIVVQRYGHSTFGKQHYQMSTAAFPVSNRFTGQQKDDDTGLCYYGARYYDPEVARFVQADSIIPDEYDTQAHDRYAYVRNNPLNLTDPSGHDYNYVEPPSFSNNYQETFVIVGTNNPPPNFSSPGFHSGISDASRLSAANAARTEGGSGSTSGSRTKEKLDALKTQNLVLQQQIDELEQKVEMLAHPTPPQPPPKPKFSFLGGLKSLGSSIAGGIKSVFAEGIASGIEKIAGAVAMLPIPGVATVAGVIEGVAMVAQGNFAGAGGARVGAAAGLVGAGAIVKGVKMAIKGGHHAIPKFLGGKAKQFLVGKSDLTWGQHQKLHAEIRSNLRGAGSFPGFNKSRDVWRRSLSGGSGGSQADALRVVSQTTRAFDAKNGTNAFQFFKENLRAKNFDRWK